MYAAGTFGERAGLLLRKRNYCAVRLCRRADRENACGISNAIAHLGEGAEDDSACGGKLVQMVHDLDLITVGREDVLFTGVGVGVLARGDGRRIGICGLFADVKAVP